jgi:hypothetical protein
VSTTNLALEQGSWPARSIPILESPLSKAGQPSILVTIYAVLNGERSVAERNIAMERFNEADARVGRTPRVSVSLYMRRKAGAHYKPRPKTESLRESRHGWRTARPGVRQTAADMVNRCEASRRTTSSGGRSRAGGIHYPWLPCVRAS